MVEVPLDEHDVIDELREFKRRIHRLCRADRLLSVASYEISEREPAPKHLSGDYSQRLAQWVLAPVIEAMGSLATGPAA
jgi:hypothetical protein